MFLETPRFPDWIALGAEGGPTFRTKIAELASGHEQRNAAWPAPRRRYRVSMVNRSQSDFDTFNAFFLILDGMAHAFRVKDWTDYLVTQANGRLGTTGIGTGAVVYQLVKRYTVGAQTKDRVINKPVAGTVVVYRNASPVTVGGAPGNVAIDTTSGEITFVADASANISAITQANPGKITTTGAHGFTTGDKVALSAIGGMTQLNGQVVTITVVDADEFTIGIATTTYSAYTSGGVASKGPQPGDALTWAGEFDVPVRFDTDEMLASARKFAGDRLALTWDQIPLIEERDPE